MKKVLNVTRSLSLIWTMALVFFLISSNVGHALFIEATDPRFGLDSVTIDTDTGLEWLDLTVTEGTAHDDVLAELVTGGTYSGYRVATSDEVKGLFTAFSFTDYETPQPKHDTFFDLFGATSAQGSYRETFGYTTHRVGPMVEVYGLDFLWYDGAPVYKLADGDGWRHNPSVDFEGFGTFLVRNPIPEPTTMLLMGLGLIGVIGRLHRSSKK